MRAHFPIFFAIAAALGASACTNDNATIWIQGLPRLTLEDDVCAASDQFIAAGSWDIGSGFSYAAFMRIQNQIRGNGRDIANDSNWVQVKRIEVTLTDANGTELDLGLANPYTIPVSGLVPSASSAEDGGSADIWGVIIPSTYASSLAGLAGGYVIANIQPFGETIGGLGVEGAPFVWPILILDTGCSRCENEATGADQCTPGQDGGCATLISEDDPICQ